MKYALVIILIILVLVFVLECDKKKKPNNPQLEDPSYYFPINLFYKWTYVSLGHGCVPSANSFNVTAASRSTRPEGSGWDLVSSVSVDTSFAYRLGDTIFYEKLSRPPYTYKVLVGPIRGGTYWKDFQYEYSIVGFEDVYSSVAGVTYLGCAKIRRTISGDTKVKFFWWAPQFGRVKEAEFNPSDLCLGGEELKSLDKTPEFP